MLKPGTQAPDFEGKLDDGRDFRLSDLRSAKNVVLYFYPKDFTPGCTREACTFQENLPAVEEYDGMIVGVSADDEASHKAFREKYHLEFPLIADPQKRIIRLYDALGLGGLMTARVTYVIDKTGTIKAAIQHDLAIGKHWSDVEAALASIQPKSESAMQT